MNVDWSRWPHYMVLLGRPIWCPFTFSMGIWHDTVSPCCVIGLLQVEDDCDEVLVHKETILVMVIMFTGWSRVICSVGTDTESWKDSCSPESKKVDSLSVAPWSHKHTLSYWLILPIENKNSYKYQYASDNESLENMSIANIPNAVYRGQFQMSYVLNQRSIRVIKFHRIVNSHLPCHNKNNKSKIALLKLVNYSRASQFDFHFG